MFTKWYRHIFRLSNHPYAVYFLALLSFLEAFISPLSPLILLIPMALSRPKRAWRLAMVATIASFCGALLGYKIGYYCMDAIEPTLISWGYAAALQQAMAWFHRWGIIALFVASLFPIPFKLFTLVAGSVKLSFVPFAVASFCARWLHFALIPLGVIGGRQLLQRWLDARLGKSSFNYSPRRKER